MSVCSVCPVSVRHMLTIMEKGDENVAWNIAVCHGLTKNTTNCPNCQGQLYVNANYKFICDGTRWSVTEDFDVEAKECDTIIDVRRGTFFKFLQHSFADILASVYCFLEVSSTVRETSCSLHLTRYVISNWNSFFCEITLHHCFHKSIVLGGPGKFVEVDGTKLGHRRYTDYHWTVKGQWIFAGVESVSGQSFVFTVDDNSEDVLIPLIEQWIRPGTIIISECWKSFTKLRDSGYEHSTNLSIKSKGTIKRSWRTLRKSIPSSCRRSTFDAYIPKSILCFQFSDENERFHQFLLAAAKLFPPDY